MNERSPSSYDDLAELIIESGIVTDPWIRGQQRFRADPLLLSRAQAAELYSATESVASVYNDVCRFASDEPALLDEFFCLTPYQKAMWTSTEPLWHGIARGDVFVTDEGLAFTELNSDTPTGEAEAVVLNQVLHRFHPGTIDPNADLAERYCSMVEAFARRMIAGDVPRTAGIVYPTEFTEDLAHIRLYKKWFEERGWDVVLGSPYNLTLADGGCPALFDVPFSVMLRHYKTDWWGERSSVWDDAEIPDREPLRQPLGIVLASILEQRAAIVNPLGSVVPQNKRSMALMWEHIHRFSPQAQETIRRFIPPTFRLEVMVEEQLITQKDQWVLKSDYGAEGEEVVIGKLTSDKIWKDSLAHACPGHWVAQRYFEARTNASGEVVNYGVFVVAGEASGIYARVHKGVTADDAFSVPCFVKA